MAASSKKFTENVRGYDSRHTFYNLDKNWKKVTQNKQYPNQYEIDMPNCLIKEFSKLKEKIKISSLQVP